MFFAADSVKVLRHQSAAKKDGEGRGGGVQCIAKVVTMVTVPTIASLARSGLLQVE